MLGQLLVSRHGEQRDLWSRIFNTHVAVPTHLFLVLALVIGFMLVSTANMTMYTASKLKALRSPEQKQYSYTGDDYPTQLPITLPQTALVQTSGEPYFSLLADDEWGTLFPPSDGFVSLGGTDARGTDDRTFLVSMYHQLHCLDVLRVSYVVNGTHAPQHVSHCLRYLRQAVLCAADATLEVDEPQFLDGRWEHAAGGVGMAHRCHDWTHVRAFVVAHPASEYARPPTPSGA